MRTVRLIIKRCRDYRVLLRSCESAVIERAVEPCADIAVLVVVRINRHAADCAVVRIVIILLRVDYILAQYNGVARCLVKREHLPLHRLIFKPVYGRGIVAVIVLTRTAG